MRTARCFGGPLHGQVCVVRGLNLQVPLYNFSANMRVFEPADIGQPVPAQFERYSLKEIHVPMGQRGLECEWSYHEWVLVPEWMSDKSIGAALKTAGYLFERKR